MEIKSGFLLKKSPHIPSSWQKRWFILTNESLSYYKNSNDNTPKGVIPLEQIVSCIEEKSNKKTILKLRRDMLKNKQIETRIFQLSNENLSEVSLWCSCIMEAVDSIRKTEGGESEEEETPSVIISIPMEDEMEDEKQSLRQSEPSSSSTVPSPIRSDNNHVLWFGKMMKGIDVNSFETWTPRYLALTKNRLYYSKTDVLHLLELNKPICNYTWSGEIYMDHISLIHYPYIVKNTFSIICFDESKIKELIFHSYDNIDKFICLLKTYSNSELKTDLMNGYPQPFFDMIKENEQWFNSVRKQSGADEPSSINSLSESVESEYEASLSDNGMDELTDYEDMKQEKENIKSKTSPHLIEMEQTISLDKKYDLMKQKYEENREAREKLMEKQSKEFDKQEEKERYEKSMKRFILQHHSLLSLFRTTTNEDYEHPLSIRWLLFVADLLLGFILAFVTFKLKITNIEHTVLFTVVILLLHQWFIESLCVFSCIKDDRKNIEIIPFIFVCLFILGSLGSGCYFSVVMTEASYTEALGQRFVISNSLYWIFEAFVLFIIGHCCSCCINRKK
jgi:hypothetical protein